MADFTLLKNSKPLYQLLWLFLLLIGFSIIIPILAMLIAIPIWGRDVVLSGISNQTPLEYLIYFQFFTQIGVFAGVAVFFARLNEANIFGYLKIRISNQINFVFFAVFAMIAIIPLSSWLLEFSLSFQYPASMSNLINSLKQQEDATNALMLRFLNVKGWGWLMFNLVFLALIPAFCEELFFRGALMTVLQRLIKNKHLVVIVTAILFSAIHMQFFSFLSRFALGLVLGYATIYSGSLFPAIAAHFVNNAFSVIGFFISDEKDIEKIGSVDNYWILILSSLVAITMIFLMHKKSLKHEHPA